MSDEPNSDEPIVGAPPDGAETPETPEAVVAVVEAFPQGGPAGAGREEHPVFSWARAIAGGIKDTARQMVDEGRKGANEAYDEGWKRFDDKTRYRRKPRG